MMKRLRFLVLAAVVACGGGSTEPTTSVNGTFTLRTINAAPLPATIYSDGTALLAINSGTLTFRSDKTYTLVEQEHTVINGIASDDEYSENGTFAQSGANLELTTPLAAGGSIRHQMVWNGDEITWTDIFINTTSTYVFRR